MPEPLQHEFLSLLDSSPREASEKIGLYINNVLASRRPKILHSFSTDDLDDFKSELIFSALKDNFKLIRKYTEMGRSFDAWFYIVVNSRAIDFIRKNSKSALAPFGLDVDRIVRESEQSQSPLENIEHRQILEAVESCISKMSTYHRILLKLASEEFFPREIVVELGMSGRSSNKKIADDLRSCRKQLTKCLEDLGISLDW